MSRCTYDSKIIEPTPFVRLEKNYQSTDDGTVVGTLWNINIHGTLVTDRGSPGSGGQLYTSLPTASYNTADSSRLGTIFRKQEALRELFSVQNKSLEFQSEDGSQPLKCYPTINSLIFNEALWYNICEYDINLTTDTVYANGTVYEDAFSGWISSATDSFSIETDELPEGPGLFRTYRLSHTVSAVGKRHFDVDGNLEKESWQQARDFVLPRLGFDSAYVNSSGVKDLPSYYGGYNFVRSESIDKLGGQYSITESWILSSGKALEDFEVEIVNSIDSATQKVSINGQITGLEDRNSNMQLVSSKYDNANDKFQQVSGSILNRAQTYAGITLNIIPLSFSIGKNPLTGVIRYAYEFDDRASNIVPNTKSEVISIQDNDPTDVIAIVGVLGRTPGPVLQPIGTSRELSRTLNLEIVLDRPPSGSISSIINNHPLNNVLTSGAIVSIIDAANPTSSFSAGQSYKVESTQNWEPKNGRFSLTRNWIYEI